MPNALLIEIIGLTPALLELRLRNWVGANACQPGEPLLLRVKFSVKLGDRLRSIAASLSFTQTPYRAKLRDDNALSIIRENRFAYFRRT
jgi:hypothetical protein